MDAKSKNITRFTFDCPTDIHCTLKIKAISYKKSVKDYLLGLIVKDLVNETPSFMDNGDFKDGLHIILKKYDKLMKGLSTR